MIHKLRVRCKTNKFSLIPLQCCQLAEATSHAATTTFLQLYPPLDDMAVYSQQHHMGRLVGVVLCGQHCTVCGGHSETQRGGEREQRVLRLRNNFISACCCHYTLSLSLFLHLHLSPFPPLSTPSLLHLSPSPPSTPSLLHLSPSPPFTPSLFPLSLLSTLYSSNSCHAYQLREQLLLLHVVVGSVSTLTPHWWSS